MFFFETRCIVELFRTLGVTDEALGPYTSEYRFKMAMSLQRQPVDTKFQVEGVTPTNHSSSQKTRLNDLSYGIKYGQIFLPFWHNARV